MMAGALATIAAAFFAGAAVYITFVEHPARMRCGPRVALMQWRPSYRRATAMQAPLAVVGTVLALLAWFMGGGPIWIASGLALGAAIPFTLVAMFPVNRALEDPALDSGSAQTNDLLARWGRLHAVRTALGTAAFLAMLFSLATHR